MKIALLSNFVSGGAGIAAQRLHLGLRGLGIDSTLFNLEKSTPDRGLEIPIEIKNCESRLKRKFRNAATVIAGWQNWFFPSWQLTPTCEIFTNLAFKPMRCLGPSFDRYDAINLHWVSGMIDLEALFSRFGGKKPLVWTLHDMRAFTGGCHYNNGCLRYRQECGFCPQLKKSSINDNSSRFFELAQAAFSKLTDDDLVVIAPSQWLVDEAKSSRLLSRFRIEHVPNGLPREFFEPLDRLKCRSDLQIESGSTALLFVADSIHNHRKGFDLLVAALDLLTDSELNLQLISIGKANGSGWLSSKMRYKHLGRIRDEKELARAYTAADLLVIPSRQDNLPNTALEALACGTPLVGFSTGGIAELTDSGKIGWLAPEMTPSALATTIRRAIAELTMTRRETCLAYSRESFQQDLQATRYLKILQDSFPGRFSP